jgi:hypothetical protein
MNVQHELKEAGVPVYKELFGELVNYANVSLVTWLKQGTPPAQQLYSLAQVVNLFAEQTFNKTSEDIHPAFNAMLERARQNLGGSKTMMNPELDEFGSLCAWDLICYGVIADRLPGYSYLPNTCNKEPHCLDPADTVKRLAYYAAQNKLVDDKEREEELFIDAMRKDLGASTPSMFAPKVEILDWCEEVFNTMDDEAEREFGERMPLIGFAEDFSQSLVKMISNNYSYRDDVVFDNYSHIDILRPRERGDSDDSWQDAMDSYITTIADLLDGITTVEMLFKHVNTGYGWDQICGVFTPAQLEILNPMVAQFCAIAVRDWGDTELVDVGALQAEEDDFNKSNKEDFDRYVSENPDLFTKNDSFIGDMSADSKKEPGQEFF